MYVCICLFKKIQHIHKQFFKKLKTETNFFSITILKNENQVKKVMFSTNKITKK